MEAIVQEVSPETLLAASYEHVTAYALHFASCINGEAYDTPQLAWGISGIPSPYMNMVVRTRLDEQDDIDGAIQAVMQRFRQRAVPLGWFLMPGSTPADMGARLLAHGLVYEGDDPGMAIDLSSLPEDLTAAGDLKIVEVLDRETHEQWISTWGDSFDVPDVARQRRFEFRASLGFGPDRPYRSFLAYLGGQPVGTSELFLGAGVAAVMWVGTIPAARGRGLGAAMTLAPLLEARRLGYRIGALTSSIRGYSVYLKLGFQEMCRIPVYCWSPPA